MQKIQVCRKDCDNKPVKEKVGKAEYEFCCEKGFIKSLKDFSDFVSKNVKPLKQK